MVCYICGEPASAQCADCHRYICSKHTRFTYCIRHTGLFSSEKCHHRTVCPNDAHVREHWDLD